VRSSGVVALASGASLREESSSHLVSRLVATLEDWTRARTYAANPSPGLIESPRRAVSRRIYTPIPCQSNHTTIAIHLSWTADVRSCQQVSFQPERVGQQLRLSDTESNHGCTATHALGRDRGRSPRSGEQYHCERAAAEAFALRDQLWRAAPQATAHWRGVFDVQEEENGVQW